MIEPDIKKPRPTNDLWTAITALKEENAELRRQLASIDQDLLSIARDVDQAKHNLTLLNQHSHRDSVNGLTSPPYLYPPNSVGNAPIAEE